MNKRSKATWVRNLRTKYKSKQTTGTMVSRSPTLQFCALGVLIDGHSRTKFQMDSLQHPWIDKKTGNPVDTDEIYKSVGLRASARNQIINLNDNDKYNFDQIADWIEKYL